MFTVENHKGREMWRGTSLEQAKRYALRYSQRKNATAIVRTDSGDFVSSFG